MRKIRLALFVVLCITEIGVLAQQAADCLTGCSCTVPLMQATTLTTQSTHGLCNTATTYSIDASKFQRIYGYAGNSYEISLCANTADTRLYVTTNSTTPAVIKCDDDGCGQSDGASSLKFSPTSSGIYRIYVFNGECAAMYPASTMMDMTMTCSVATPANDLPCGAIVLPINGSACNFTPGSNEGAFNAQASVPGVGPAPNCAGANFQGGDVWYKLILPASGFVGLRTQEGTICAGAFQLYTASACNGTFQQLPGGCVITGNTGPTSEPAIILNAGDAGVSAGDTIYIRYWERIGNEPGTFGICAFDPEIATNDEPCSAIALPLNATCDPMEFDHDIAYASEVPLPSCGVISNVQDVWFSFTVPATIPVGWPGISTHVSAAAPMDLAIAWYRSTSSTCLATDLVEIACSANGSIISAAIGPSLLNAGETIYVRVWSEVIWNGTYSVCAVMEQAPINDGPCGALDLAVEHGCLMEMYSNAFASTTGTNSTGTTWNGIPAPTCGTPV